MRQCLWPDSRRVEVAGQRSRIAGKEYDDSSSLFMAPSEPYGRQNRTGRSVWAITSTSRHLISSMRKMKTCAASSTTRAPISRSALSMVSAINSYSRETGLPHPAAPFLSGRCRCWRHGPCCSTLRYRRRSTTRWTMRSKPAPRCGDCQRSRRAGASSRCCRGQYTTASHDVGRIRCRTAP